MKLLSSVPESKSIHYPCRSSFWDCQDWFTDVFLKGKVILIWRLINKIKAFANNRTANWNATSHDYMSVAYIFNFTANAFLNIYLQCCLQFGIHFYK